MHKSAAQQDSNPRFQCSNCGKFCRFWAAWPLWCQITGM